MGLVTDVRVRQPKADDLVGDTFVVAGIGNGFEGTIGIRVLGGNGRMLGQGSAQSSGGMAGIGDFATTVTLERVPRPGTRVTVQVFGDNPGLPGEGPDPGFHLREVPVLVFGGMTGFLLHRVERGDTLTSILRGLRDLTRATTAQVVAANPRIEDPDVVKPGWRLRIPILS